jgi:GT2 family glycosyltransferase
VSPLIAVAISTRDRPHALRRCLASLAAGERIPHEVVVADQSSSEATWEVVDDAARNGLPARHVRARPGGLGAAQNDAIRSTTGHIVAVLDDDCVADSRWLRELSDAFTTDEGLALVAGRVLPLGKPTPNTFPVSSRVSTIARDFTGKSPPWDVGSGNNFAVRREWFDRIGGCDERLGPGARLRGGLDMDLFYRLLRAGGRARYEPAAVVLHERVTRQGRLDRRSAYGFGMGAALTLWLRDGDGYAWHVLARWAQLRSIQLARALVRGRLQGVHEELLVLWGTLAGIMATRAVPLDDR